MESCCSINDSTDTIASDVKFKLEGEIKTEEMILDDDVNYNELDDVNYNKLDDVNYNKLDDVNHNESDDVNCDEFTPDAEQLAEEEYNREIREQRYKRLMHLLNKSQFYASYLVDKISKSTEKAKTTKRKSRPVVNDENKPPQTSKRKRDLEKYDIQEYISIDVQKQVQDRKWKLNLDSEEIKAELIADSDSDTETEEAHIKEEATTVLKYFNGELRDYQQEGLQWLKVLYENGLNGILADEMGLGKTIQVIALICHLFEKRQSGPYLISAPLSTLSNWLEEFERFAPDIPIVVFQGRAVKRAALYNRIRRKHHIISHGYKAQPVVITNFDVLLHETKFIQSQKWRYIIIDEGHRIKNHNCILAKNLRAVPCMNRLLLTGTPLQNNLAELWSLLNFLLPEIFDDLAIFESWVDTKELQHKEGTEKFLKQEEEKHVLLSLREILKPFMLRREKSDVCLDIPAKKELIVYAPLTELQHDLYQAVLNYDLQILNKLEKPKIIIPTVDGKRPKRQCVLKNKSGTYNKLRSSSSFCEESEDSNSNEWETIASRDQKTLSMWKQYTDVTQRNQDFLIHVHTGNRVAMYKRIVNHPYLVHCPLNSVGLPKIDNDLITSSGKLLVLDAMLAKLKVRGHKVLLFSTMTMILDVIEDYLSMRDYNYVRLDGRTEVESRKEYIRDFNNNPDMFLFLISTRAGGIGLNLAGADTVIIYDSDWNPQADIQAMARCHRIGQTKPVVVYRLCTKGTIDETIIQRSEGKRILEKMVISKELRSLRKGALLKLKELLESKEYKIVTSESAVFTEAELNNLLDRSDMINDMIKKEII